MSLESNRTLGGIGAILLAIPFMNLVGIILVLIAMKGMSDFYKDENIFKNALYGFIFGFVGVIALVATILLFAFGFASTSPVITPYRAVAFTGFGLIIIALSILFVFSLVGAIFYKKSLNKLAEKSGEQMLNTAGLVLLLGAAIPVVGEVLKFVAWILAAVGFFNIRNSAQMPAHAAAVSVSEEQRFCKYCGEQIQSNAVFCPKCGKKKD